MLIPIGLIGLADKLIEKANPETGKWLLPPEAHRPTDGGLCQHLTHHPTNSNYNLDDPRGIYIRSNNVLTINYFRFVST